MLRPGLVVAVVLVGSGCSIHNPFFDVRGDGSETQAETGEPTGTPTSSEASTSASSESDGETQGSVTTGAPELFCGDGQVDGVEACDDGNDVETDACPSSCEVARCGDAVVWAGVESCDDGNNVGGDDCPAGCKSLSCGDGQVDGANGEQCDDGDQVDDDECSNVCVKTYCGDGGVQQGEGCDDGNDNDGDACLAGCKPAVCGDGVVQDGVEGCDDGNEVVDDGCDGCVSDLCGNGVMEGIEQCDDGNPSDMDACTNSCNLAVCGDDFVQAGVEQCDDGNNLPDDGCFGCEISEETECGNGVLEGMEECDPGMEPYKSLDVQLCSDGCVIDSCFRVKNTMMTEIVGNDWLDVCATKGGSQVVVTLLDEALAVKYMARGIKVGMAWQTSNLTAGLAPPSAEFNVKNHTQLVPLLQILPKAGEPELLMLTSKEAGQANEYGCPSTLGDGYAIAVYPPLPDPKIPRMLVMGEIGGQSKKHRKLDGFGPEHEISYDATGMSVCVEATTPFVGTFLLSVL